MNADVMNADVMNSAGNPIVVTILVHYLVRTATALTPTSSAVRAAAAVYRGQLPRRPTFRPRRPPFPRRDHPSRRRRQ